MAVRRIPSNAEHLSFLPTSRVAAHGTHRQHLCILWQKRHHLPNCTTARRQHLPVARTRHRSAAAGCVHIHTVDICPTTEDGQTTCSVCSDVWRGIGSGVAFALAPMSREVCITLIAANTSMQNVEAPRPETVRHPVAEPGSAA